MENHQAWRMRWLSYKFATIVVCSFNLVVALLLFRCFLGAATTKRTLVNVPELAKLHYIRESEDIRRSFEPLQLIKRVRDIEQEVYTELETTPEIVPKQTAAVDLSKRLQDFRAMNDEKSKKALEEWRKRKMERARQRELEKNVTIGPA